MQNSRLLAVYQTLSKKEQRELALFVNSPFFNQRDDVLQLLKYLAQQQNNLAKLNKPLVHAAIYPSAKTVDLQQVRLIMSKLLLLIEQYLSYQEGQAEKKRINLNLAAVYRKRGLEKHFQQTIGQIKARRKKQQLKNAEYYYEEFLIEQEWYRFSSQQQRTGEHNLQSVFNAMDISFFAYKLRQACLFIAHQAVYKTDYKIELLDEVLELIKKHQYHQLPAIGVYYHIYYALTAGDFNHFSIFKNLIIEQPEVFPDNEIRDLYLLAINYCIKQLNSGQESFAAEGFTLYQRGLELGVLLENGFLSRFSYRNVVAIGLFLKKFDWIEEFIQKYKDHLDPKYKTQTYSFNMARLEYTRKNYDSALPLLQHIEYSDLLLNLAAKTILLKIYYETKAFDLLDAHLSSLQNYLRRKTVISYHKENYKNIISITRKLVNHNHFDQKEKEKIRQLIIDAEVLTERKWLLEQV